MLCYLTLPFIVKNLWKLRSVSSVEKGYYIHARADSAERQ